MEPNIEDINSPEIQREIQKLDTLNKWTVFAGPITMIGTLITSFWLIYRVYTAFGFWAALLSFILLSLIYRMGPSPMFAVSSSILCFYFKAVGVWLPVLSYALAAILLYMDLRTGSLKRRVDPYNLGSIHDR